MIDKLAAAMQDADAKRRGNLYAAAEYGIRERFRVMARAAIKAMREPTEGMVKDGNRSLWPNLSVNIDVAVPDDAASKEAWEAMIDAALAE